MQDIFMQIRNTLGYRMMTRLQNRKTTVKQHLSAFGVVTKQIALLLSNQVLSKNESVYTAHLNI